MSFLTTMCVFLVAALLLMLGGIIFIEYGIYGTIAAVIVTVLFGAVWSFVNKKELF